MAEQDVRTNIVATANFSDLIGNLNRVTSSLVKLQQQVATSNRMLSGQIGQMNKSFAETLRSTGQFSTHFVSLTSDVDKFGSQLDKGQLKLNQYFKVWQDHSRTSAGLVRDLARQQVQMQNAVLQPLGKNAEGLMQYNVHIPQGLNEIKNKTAIARQELQIMNKVMQQGAGQLINWGKNTQWAGRQLTVGLTVPMAAFGKAAADAFRQADEQLVRLTKVYGGLSATSSTELAKVRKDVAATAAELSKSYGVSFKDTLGLAADIAATGKQGNELLGSIKETSRLAVLGEVDRQDAMKATLALQNAFKQNTDQLAESINFLNSVENQTSTTLNDLITAIPKAGPVIEGMGGSVKDLALYLTAMKEGGVNATEGANALKSSIASLINPTKVAVGMFKGFGIDLKGIVTENAGNLTATILELQSALDSLDPLQKQQAIEQLFGKFQFARMNALFANLGKQGSQTLQVMDLMKASSQELAGIAGRELQQVTESASGKYRRAIEGLKADLASIGDQFLTITTHLINFVDGVIKFTQKLPGPIKQVLGFMGLLTATAGPLIMLTGVLGNFFGYIIKGAYHLKSLFRGGEGWKLLTPEIMAANNAGSLIEKTFYSDAQAAAVLKQAISNLSAELVILQQKANGGAISVLPAMQNATGMTTTTPGGREVNPNHPLISPKDTRSMSHMIPRGMPQGETIFGVVPGAPRVNQKISNNPQMYMEGDLPKIPGLTSIGGASTGVVAEEAAKWHSMTAAIAMQSDAELKLLKQEVLRTGTITTGLSDSYQTLLPQMSLITKKAAAETAAIVAELQASKITVDQARAKIITLNAQIEQMMASTATTAATSMGRSINLTKVPLVDQPIIDPTGKSNMKELTRPGRTRDLLNKIAGRLGVKTFGAPYSTETTIPKRLNRGNIVPGTGNTDTVPAMLTPGEFVVNKEATAANLPLLHAINGGQQSNTNQYNIGGIAGGFRALASLVGGARRIARPGIRPSNRVAVEPGALDYNQMQGRAGRNSVWNDPILGLGRPNSNEVVGHLFTNNFYSRIGKRSGRASSPQLTSEDLSGKTGIQISSASGYAGPYDILPNNYMVIPKDFNRSLNAGTATAQQWLTSNRGPQHLTSLLHYLISQGVPKNSALSIARTALNQINSRVSRIPGPISEAMFGNIVTNTSNSVIKNSPLLSGQKINMNMGGEVPGYNGGGKVLSSSMQKLIAKWGKVYGGNRLANDDPLHGPLNIGRYRPPVAVRNRRQQAQIVYRGGYKPIKWNSGPMAGKTTMSPTQSSHVPAFLTGSLEDRGRYVTEEYMRGAYGVLDNPGAREAMLAVRKKASGQFFRGINLQGSGMRPLPEWLLSDIKVAQATGDFSKLVGKEFIMRRSSWSTNPDTAKGFGAFNLSAKVKSRKVTPASEMFPELSFPTLSGPVKVNESESIFGGKFRIVGANPNGLEIETVNGPLNGKRRFGGSISAGGSYVVGENGPEIFKPESSGKIIPRFAGGGLVGQMVGGTAGYMGGSSIGSSMGGQTGSMIGGMVGSMAVPMALSAIGNLSQNATPGVSKLKLALAGLRSIPGPTMAVAGLVTLGLTIKNINDRINEHKKIVTLGFAPTDEAAEKLGLGFKSLSSQIKDYSAATKLAKANNIAFYASVKSAGVQGLNLTIKQLKDLKKSVKEDFPEYIKIFNSAKPEEVITKAKQLKAQFIAGGMAADKASQLIYGIVSSSDKAFKAISILGNEGFSKIKDKSSAASVSIDTFNKLLSKGNTDQLAAGFDQLLNSVQAYEKSLIGTKDESGKQITQVDAISMAFEKLNSSALKNVELGESGVDALSKQDAILGLIVNRSDTAAGAFAKIKLYLSGADLDLKSINSELAISIARTVELANAQMSSSKGIFGPLATRIKTLETSAQKANKENKAAAEETQASLNNQIKKHQKIIDQIKEQADARIKAIQRENDAENVTNQIKKKQIEYQQALASGDMAGAATAQLDIQSLSNERQKQVAIDSINDKADKDVKKQQNIIDSLQSKIDGLQKQIVSLSKKAESDKESASYLQDLLSRAEAAALESQNNVIGKAETANMAKIASELAKAGFTEMSKQFEFGPSMGGYGIKNTFEEVLKSALKPGGAKLNINDEAIISALKGTKFGDTKTDTISPGQKIGEPKATTGNTLKEAVLSAQGGKTKAGTWTQTGTDQVFDLFKWKGKTYAVDKITGSNVYEFDTKKNNISGKRLNFNLGGPVFGSGTATSDSIPAMLSNGEYVINAKSVQAAGLPLLDSINKMAMGGLATRYNIPNNNLTVANSMPGFRNGGMVNHYSVGGIVVNGAPGQNVEDLATIVMGRIENINTVQSRKTGGYIQMGSGL